MTPLLTFITFALTGSVLFLLGWSLGFSYGSKRRVFEPQLTLKCSNRSFMSRLEEDSSMSEHTTAAAPTIHVTLKVTDPRDGGSVQRYPVEDDEQVIGEESLAWRNEGFEVEVEKTTAEMRR